MKSGFLRVAVVAILWACAGPGAHAQLPDLDLGLGGGGDSGGGGIDLPLGPSGLPGSLEEQLPPALRDALPELLSPRPTDPVVLDHAAALRAVYERRALPLNDLLKGVAKLYRGEVIDVQLIRFRDTLLYEVKMVDTRGRVSLVYFNAVNGTPARLPAG